MDDHRVNYGVFVAATSSTRVGTRTSHLHRHRRLHLARYHRLFDLPFLIMQHRSTSLGEIGNAYDPTSGHSRVKARIVGAIIGIFFSLAAAVLVAYGDWVVSGLEGAVACGVAGALLGPVVAESPKTGRKILIVALAVILASIAGAINLTRNDGWWGESDILLQAKLDPMASPHLADYRLCSKHEHHGGFLEYYQYIGMMLNTGSVSPSQAAAAAIKKATEHGWTDGSDVNGTWLAYKPRIPGNPGQTLQIAIWSDSPPYPPDPSCHLSISIGNH